MDDCFRVAVLSTGVVGSCGRMHLTFFLRQVTATVETCSSSEFSGLSDKIPVSLISGTRGSWGGVRSAFLAILTGVVAVVTATMRRLVLVDEVDDDGEVKEEEDDEDCVRFSLLVGSSFFRGVPGEFFRR